MSQLRTIQSARDSNNFSKLTWEEFVHTILVLTIRAYQAMQETCPVQQDWEENTFTINLDNYIRPLAFDMDLPIRSSVRTKVHTESMYAGDQATIEAKEIDLLLYGFWERDHHNVHFVWEAKRVGDKRVKPSYGNLNAEYVNEAIYRFIHREYADGLKDAGVLGYVLGGEVGNIMGDINQSMGRLRVNKPLPVTNHLRTAPAINQFEDIYESTHTRTDNSSIRLHHLFLVFNFPPV